MKWNNVRDIMPEDNKDVLVYVDAWDLIIVGRYTGRVWVVEDQTANVLHWMDLPYSPNELK